MMAGTPKSGLLLALSCITAIAAVGSIFELSSGDAQLGNFSHWHHSRSQRTANWHIFLCSRPGCQGKSISRVISH